MIFARRSMPPSSRRMRVRVAVVVVPYGANIARVGFEEEFGNGVDPGGIEAADRTWGGVGRLHHGPLPLVLGLALGAGIEIRRHALAPQFASRV